MKKIQLLLISIALFIGQEINAQNISFTKNEIFEDERLTADLRLRSQKIDFDNDGDQDVVVGNHGNSRRIQLFVNNAGQFDSAIVLLDTFNTSIKNINSADIDSDGLEDIVIIDNVNIHSMLNQGNGSFSSPSQAGGFESNIESDLHSFDINKDSYIDLYWVKNNQIRWAENDSSGNFRPIDTIVDLSSYLSTNNLQSITEVYLRDIENDGDIDYVVQGNTSGGSRHFTLVIDSLGTFVFKSFSTSFQNGEIAVADFNNDSIIDIAASVGFLDEDLVIHHLDSNYSISFSSIIHNENSRLSIGEVYAADVNKDGLQDIILDRSSNYAGRGLIYINDSNGTSFTLYKGYLDNFATLPVGGGSGFLNSHLLTDDFNQDGRLDFVSYTTGNKDLIYHEQLADSTFDSFNYLNSHLWWDTRRVDYFDVNADGHKDIVFPGKLVSGKIQVKYNDGNQNFNTKEIVSANVSPVRVDALITDLNSDGNLDLLYANNKTIRWHSNYQNPSNDTLINLYTNAAFSNGGNDNIYKVLRVIDIDFDGDLDILYVDQTLRRINLIENINNATFSYSNIGSSSGTIQNYQLGDIDNDNKVEMMYFQSNSLYITKYDSSTKSMSMVDTVSATISSYKSRGLALSDLDNDGDLDLVSDYAGLNWFENIGGGQYFETDSVLTTFGSGYSERLAVGDLNNDGLDDYAHPEERSGVDSIHTYINQGNRTFKVQSHEMNHINRSSFISMEDIDGDGKDDVVLDKHESGLSTQAYWFRTCFETVDTISLTACDVYSTLSGKLLSSTGVFNDTIMNADGCDSIITINLTINQSAIDTTQITACNFYTWSVNNTTYTNSGFYTDSLQTTLGCDSVNNLSLNIIKNDTTISQSGNTLSVPSGATSYQWLDCNNAFATIPGETNNTYSPVANGDYAVEVSNGSCTDTSMCYNYTITGLSQNDATINSEISIYPNPSNGLFSIDLGEKPQSGWYRIRDIQGKVIQEQQFNTQQLVEINFNQPKGIYFIEIKKGDGEIAVRKLIKQ